MAVFVSRNESSDRLLAGAISSTTYSYVSMQPPCSYIHHREELSRVRRWWSWRTVLQALDLVALVDVADSAPGSPETLALAWQP